MSVVEPMRGEVHKEHVMNRMTSPTMHLALLCGLLASPLAMAQKMTTEQDDYVRKVAEASELA